VVFDPKTVVFDPYRYSGFCPKNNGFWLKNRGFEYYIFLCKILIIRLWHDKFCIFGKYGLNRFSNFAKVWNSEYSAFRRALTITQFSISNKIETEFVFVCDVSRKINFTYRFPLLFVVDTFCHLGSRILNLAYKKAIFD